MDAGSIAAGIIECVTSALRTFDFYTAAYFIRRLAAELGGDEWTKAELFTQVESLVRGEEFDGSSFEPAQLSRRLTDLLIVRKEQGFIAELNVAPVRINRKILNTDRQAIQLVAKFDEEERRMLTGLRIKVEAVHHSLAATRALEMARDFLELLRLRHYVVTHIYGSIKVQSETAGETQAVLLPQPFWSKHAHGNRPILKLPSHFVRLTNTLDPQEQSRWYAARWHLSEAFSDWAEDVHSAAARVWQGLESFSPFQGDPFERVAISVVPAYLRVFTKEATKFTAGRLREQVHHYNLLNEKKHSDWYWWNPRKEEVEHWLRAVLNGYSLRSYERWRKPPAPEAVFDHKIGILQVLRRRISQPDREKWFESRLLSDLALLYGLRNAAVHGGRRLFSSRMANYLGRLGAEIVLTLMSQRAAGASTNELSDVLEMREILRKHFE